MILKDEQKERKDLLKENLLEIKQEVEQRIRKLINENIRGKNINGEISKDWIDQVSNDIEDELVAELLERNTLMLQNINSALVRLNRGTYGFCDSCGTEINIERLQAVPFASKCIDCQRESEKNIR